MGNKLTDEILVLFIATKKPRHADHQGIGHTVAQRQLSIEFTLSIYGHGRRRRRLDNRRFAAIEDQERLRIQNLGARRMCQISNVHGSIDLNVSAILRVRLTPFGVHGGGAMNDDIRAEIGQRHYALVISDIQLLAGSGFDANTGDTAKNFHKCTPQHTAGSGDHHCLSRKRRKFIHDLPQVS